MKSTKRKSKGPQLVTNDAAAPTTAVVTNQFQSFSWNAATALVRNDTMEGKDYVVVPMVMITEGVLNGSKGPLYYPKDELAKIPEVWNHKPVVVYHPSRNGQGVSACSPEVLTSCKIGVIMNTRFTKLGQLKAEAWIEEDRCKLVDERVWEAIENKQMLELSTGVFTDNEMTPGKFGNIEYDGIARNYRPDHLAILPDLKGACSIEAGAGFIRNMLNASFQKLESEDIELIHNRVIRVLEGEKKKNGAIAKLLTNELSYEAVRGDLGILLRKKFPEDQGFAFPWIESVYDDFFVYCFGSGLFKQSYSREGASVKLVGEPRKVVRVTEYVDAPVSNNLASNSNQNDKTEIAMNKKTIVDELIGNHGYAEADRASLMALSDNSLQSILTNAKKPAPAASKSDAAAPAANSAPAAAPVETPAAKPVASVDDYINNAPAELRDVLRSGITAHNQTKTNLIDAIVANKSNQFTKEYLGTLSLDMLKGIAQIAQAGAPATNSLPQTQQPVPMFVGNGAANGAPLPVSNAEFCKPENAIPSPDWSFTK